MTDKERCDTANLFLKQVEDFLIKAKKDFGSEMCISISFDEEFFSRAIESLDFIQELGKQKRINIERMEESEAIEEYGIPYCFNCERF